jgi:hypothetical protein
MAAVLMSILMAVSARNLYAQQTIISFDNRTSLAALFYKGRSGGIVRAGRYTFVTGRDDEWGNAYVEHSMKFFNGVNPLDPELASGQMPEYHLNYEEPNVDFFNSTFVPEDHPRYLAAHLPGAVIQMTYDPNNDGIPDPFNLISIKVLSGWLDVGVKFADGSIAVYNHLTEGFTWFLVDANNVVRATLELPRLAEVPTFAVDDIVFEPGMIPGGAPARPTSDEVGRNFTPPYIDPPRFSLSFRSLAPPPKIDVKPGDDTNTIDPQDTGNLHVAILATGGFNPRIVDCDSIRLGPNEGRPLHCEVHDVNRDGHPDLLVLFSIPEIGLQCGDRFLFLTAQAGDGTVTGQDFIHLTGCNETATPPPIFMPAPAAEDAALKPTNASHMQILKRQNREARPMASVAR